MQIAEDIIKKPGVTSRSSPRHVSSRSRSMFLFQVRLQSV